MDNKMDRAVDLTEAAKRLGTTTEAVRKRLQRGQLTGYKEDGRWYVLLDERQDTPDNESDSGQDGVHHKGDLPQDNQYIEHLQNEVTFLREQLNTRDEELRRKDHIIAGLAQKIPLIPEVAVTKEEGPDLLQQIESRLEERDRKLMETLRAIQEKKKKRWRFW